MTEEAFKRAEQIRREIENLEDFMFWCSGKKEGERKLPTRIIVLKRAWIGGLRSSEYEIPDIDKEEVRKKVQQAKEEGFQRRRRQRVERKRRREKRRNYGKA